MSTPGLPEIPATRHLDEGIEGDPFRDMHVGPLGRYQVVVSAEDVERWARIHEERHPWSAGAGAQAAAPPSILYYASMNILAPIRYFRPRNSPGGAALARYWAEFSAPIPVGVPIEISGEVTDKYTRRGRGFVDWHIEARAGGRLLQRNGKNWFSGIPEDEARNWPERPGGARPPEAPEGAERFGPITYPVTQEHMSDFEGGDRNAHSSADLARQQGETRTTAQGALSFGLLSRLATERFGESFTAGGSLDVRFIQRVHGGDVLTAQGALLGPDGEGRHRARVWAQNQDGVLTAVGVATARA